MESLALQPVSEGDVSAFDYLSVQQYMHMIGPKDGEETNIMRDQHDGKSRMALAQMLEPFRHHRKRVQIQTRICLIKQGKLGFEHEHLQDFEFLFLPAGKTAMDRAILPCALHFEQRHLSGQTIVKLQRRDRFLPGREGGVEKILYGHPCDLARMLKSQKEPRTGPSVDRKAEKILPCETHRSPRHLRGRMPHERMYQRGFPGTIGPEDHV